MFRSFLRTPDGQSAIFFVFFGAATVYFGSALPFGTLRQMGPGFFPVCLGVLLVVAGLFVGVSALRNMSETITPVDWRALVCITTAGLAAAFLLRSVGLAIAIPVMVIIATLAAGRFRPLPVIVTAVVLTFLAWAIFILGLGLRIPVLEF